MEMIDKVEIVFINKFIYLCGLLGLKVKIIVEVLLFIVEGYNRVKLLLLSNYGKEFEVIKVYVKEIMVFFVIISVNFRKISEFSEILMYCV